MIFKNSYWICEWICLLAQMRCSDRRGAGVGGRVPAGQAWQGERPSEQGSVWRLTKEPSLGRVTEVSDPLREIIVECSEGRGRSC